MKRIVVGRGDDCDIVIPDSTDNVSRRHLVISFGLFGNMKISDTSSNGTFINERRMLKGASIPVKREDKIRLGDSWILDWDQVKDPYKKLRVILVAALCVLMAAGIAFIAIGLLKKDKSEDKPVIVVPAETEEAETEWNKDSTANVAPVEKSIEVKNAEKVEAPRKNPPAKRVNNNVGKKTSKEPVKIGRPMDDMMKDDAEPIKIERGKISNKEKEVEEIPIM